MNPHFLTGLGTVGLAIAAYAGTHTYLDFHTGPASGRETTPAPTPPASALADRQGGAASASGSPVRVVHRVRPGGDAGFRADLLLTNTGAVPVRHWRLSFTYPYGKLRSATGARLDRSGRSPVLYGKGAHATLSPGESVRIRLTGTGVAESPYGCKINGEPCGFT